MTLTWTVEKPAWRCGCDVVRAEALELRRGRRSARRTSARGAGRERLLVDVEAQAVDVEVALGDPVALQLLVDHLAEAVHADLVDEHLDAGAGAVDAQEVRAVEDPEDTPRRP